GAREPRSAGAGTQSPADEARRPGKHERGRDSGSGRRARGRARHGEAGFMMRTLFVIVLTAFLVSGCNWFRSLGKKDNVEPPRELVEFAPTAAVQTLWTTSAGDGADESG